VLPSTGTAASSSAREPTTAMAEIDYDSGIFGGLAGGLVTGALLSVVYNKWTTRPIPLVKLLPLVTAFFGIAVAALGWLVAVITSWFARLQRSAWIFNEITACLVAGVMAGLLSGPAIAWHFGKHQKDWDFAGPAIILAGVLPGCVIVGIFIATWDQWPLSRRLMRSIITSTIAAWIIGLTAGAAADATGLSDRLYHQLYDAGTPGGRLQGGVIYGLIIGTISGLVIGVSLALSRRWPTRVIAATRAARPPAETLAE